MKPLASILVALVVGAALGAGAVEALRADTKPPAFVIAEIDVANADAFTKEFVPIAGKDIESAGGKFLTRGGKTATFVGAPPRSRVSVFQFENLEAAQAWWDSPGRKEAYEIGRKYGDFRVFAVEGLAQ